MMSQYTAFNRMIWAQSGERWPKLHRLLRPSGSIYMGDNMRINPSPVDHFYMNMGAFYTFIEVGPSSERHGQGANFLYFDGHVELLHKADQSGSARFHRAVYLRGQL
jgi:prepilin-type processing-associated H-X9-DG protein